MAGDKYITLSIHTYERAVALKKILVSHGIDVQFEKLVISGSGIASGVRVKINERDLPLALRITESTENIVSNPLEMNFEGTKGNVLIPVDFSPNSMLSCRIGFDLANRLSSHPVILHAYTTPYFSGVLSGNDTEESSVGGTVPDDVAEMEIGVDIKMESERMMRSFRKRIELAQREGTVNDIKFSTVLSEGVPEDVIKDYCRQTPPVVVVMATRGKAKRDEALVGSVTAEVLDSCRVPVFAVPENNKISSVEAVNKLAYFCNLDQHDILSIDSLMRMFEYPEAEIALIPVNERAGSDILKKTNVLRDYFNKNYPSSRFTSEVFPTKTFREHFEHFVSTAGIELLIVPNRKRNIFSRLFNPGIAHKMLFERDMPMLALPV